MDRDKLVEKFERDVAKRPYWLRLLLVTDQFFNVLIWNGSQDETISSHIGRRMADGKAYRVEKWICAGLKKLEHNHCIKSKGE